MTTDQTVGKLDRETQVLIEGLAPLVAEGYTVEQLASRTDLPLSRVQYILSLPEFLEILKKIDPAAFENWIESKEQDRVSGKVRAIARDDALEHYRLLKSLARDPDLRPDIKAGVLEKLLRLGGQFKEQEALEENVTLAPAMIKAWMDAIREIRE